MNANDRPLIGLTVLIAEDSWHLADALHVTIERAGGTVVGPVGTLSEAEDLAATAAFDAAVIDINLHDEMTYDLAERLADKGIRIVVLTGYRPSPELQSLQHKIHACLIKPAATEAIIAALSPQRQP